MNKLLEALQNLENLIGQAYEEVWATDNGEWRCKLCKGKGQTRIIVKHESHCIIPMVEKWLKENNR